MESLIDQIREEIEWVRRLKRESNPNDKELFNYEITSGGVIIYTPNLINPGNMIKNNFEFLI